ncbi:peptidylprolyl isomerase [Synechococcus sp. CS-1329]|uniref:peptidylprolyl isomerase n=1 Tax=Synechococcus sp. CS-1329 TaxID=2847975 RepID=UPI00223C09B2|nr:peptidylprolyl isomerase [Synechococcus sp. CS-1329]MCT0218885.1 peptidylprolyl isomerase [Synechococcus sp. CS-1329]
MAGVARNLSDFSCDYPAEVLRQLHRHNLLAPLVRAELIARTVADEPMSDEERAGTLTGWLEQQNLKGEESLATYLKQQGLSHDDWEWQVLLPQRIRRFSAREFGLKAESRFLARKNQLDRVVYSLLRLKDGALARELYLRISGGEAGFAELAARYSEGQERLTNGVIGPVPLTQPHPALAEKLRTSQEGETIGPLHLGEWWLVVRVERRLPASFDAAMAEQMNLEQFNEWLAKQTTDTMKSALARVEAHGLEGMNR